MTHKRIDQLRRAKWMPRLRPRVPRNCVSHSCGNTARSERRRTRITSHYTVALPSAIARSHYYDFAAGRHEVEARQTSGRLDKVTAGKCFHCSLVPDTNQHLISDARPVAALASCTVSDAQMWFPRSMHEQISNAAAAPCAHTEDPTLMSFTKPMMEVLTST